MNSRTILLCLALGACDDPTSVQVSDATDATVYRLWWQTTLFTTPVAAGGSSEVERAVPASDYAYALLAPGWDAGSLDVPSVLLPVRSRDRLSVARGTLLTITVEAASWDGFCDAGTPLSQDTADLITQDIFPAQFAQRTYDAASCSEGAHDGGP